MSEEKAVKIPLVNEKNFKLVPPDGGWGYFIWVAVIIVYICSTAFFPCFGMIFNDFMTEIKMGSTCVALLNGLNGIFLSLSGYTAGPLLKIMSMRKLASLGSLLFLIGCAGLFFIETQTGFFISQAFQSCGGGFLYNVACTILNDYFLTKRLLSVALTQAVSAFAGMLTPLFVKWSLEEYGYRGTLMLMMAISMHILIAAVLMQPVEWHLKKELLVEDKQEENSLLPKSASNETKTTNNATEIALKIGMTDKEKTKNDVISNSLEELSKKISKMTEEVKKSKSIRDILMEVFDLHLFKNLGVISTCLGVSIALFAESTFALMLPQALYSIEWSEERVAWALTLSAISDFSSRISIMIFNKQLSKWGSRRIYLAGLIIAIGSKLGMLLSKNETVIIAFITLGGVSRCSISVLIPVVLSECVEQNYFAQAMGMTLLLYGIISLALGPIIGAIRDLTTSYAASFYVLNSFFAIVIMFWCIEMCYLRNIKKHIKKIEYKQTSKAK